MPYTVTLVNVFWETRKSTETGNVTNLLFIEILLKVPSGYLKLVEGR